MEENINALDEMHKGACMGMDAINFVLDKVEDKKLKKVLKKEYKKYEDIALEIEEIYPKYNNDEPHKTGAMTKAMTWYGIEKKTLLDNSTSKIAELLMEGTNMGIVEGRKILNRKQINKEVMDLVKTYVDMQEENVEVLKGFL